MTDRLFDAPARRRGREWGRWLPVPTPARCRHASCDTPLVRMPRATQLALFFHGGYGAAERSTVEFCPGCGWVRTVAVETVNPLRT